MILYTEEEVERIYKRITEAMQSSMVVNVKSTVKALDKASSEALSKVFADAFIEDPKAEKFKEFRMKLWLEHGHEIERPVKEAFIEMWVKNVHMSGAEGSENYQWLNSFILKVIRLNPDLIDNSKFESVYKEQLDKKESNRAYWESECRKIDGMYSKLLEEVEELRKLKP